MKRCCNFQMNAAFRIGITVMCVGLLLQNVLEVQGPALAAAHFLCGAGVGLGFVGLLYGSPKTQPLFHKFCAFKLRLLGRESGRGSEC